MTANQYSPAEGEMGAGGRAEYVADIARWDAVESAINAFVNEYVFEGEDESGRDLSHTPTAQEQLLIVDAVQGLFSDDRFVSAYTDFAIASPPAEQNARLIAAAPALLDACKSALYLLKGREHDQFLRDAIAAAEGRS